MDLLTKYKSLLNDFISFKSISTDANFSGQCKQTAEWLINLFNESGFETKLIEGFGNSLVYAEYNKDQSLETCLIYGHYDVQPAAISDGWKSDPFTVYEEGSRIYARGIVDNKGQVLIHIANVLSLIESGNLKYNIKFIIEGDEESGSEEIEKFFEEHASILKSDFVLISDGELTMGHPTIDIGFRGIINSTLELTTSAKDNHSGLYGGSIPNAANVLSQILSKMHDEKGVLRLPGLNNNPEVSDEIIQNNLNIPFYYDEFKSNTGAKVRLNENNIDFYTQVGVITSAEVTSLTSGYLGEGYRNAIPGKAIAKINFRLSPFHKTEELESAFTNFLKVAVPEFAEFKITFDQKSEAINLKEESDYISQAKVLLKDIYGKESFYRYCGAIVPIAGLFKQYLKIPVLDIGLGNEDCNMHGANENFEIETLKRGLEFSSKFLGR
jgi:acetylornithine deacetylase/succinyl-diaminopimelate desuccinylase-like protein